MSRRKGTNNAVSEIIGTVLLLGISVSLFTIVYISVLSVPSSPPTPSASIICEINEGSLVFTHIGGEALSENTRITLSLPETDASTSIVVKNNMSAEARSDGTWGFGEKVTYYNASFLGRAVDFSIIDLDTNAIVVAGAIPAIDPIITFVNNIIPFVQTGSTLDLTASSTGTDPDNVTLWYKWNGYWEDTFENGDELVSLYHNMTFENGYAEVNMSGEGTDIIDYVDNENVAVDGVEDVGTHSDFSAEKAGPDDNYDILTEEYTGSTGSLLSDGFEGSPWDDNWDENGNTPWVRVSDETHGGSYAAYCEYNNQGNLISNDLNTIDAEGIRINFWYYLDGNIEEEDILLYYYDGHHWDFITYLGNGNEEQWFQYTDLITDSQYFKPSFKIRLTGSQNRDGEEIRVDDVDIIALSTILSENFESSFPPAGWDVTNDGASGSCVWEQNDEYGRPNNAGTGHCADADADKCGSSGPWPMDTLLITPSFDLSDSTVSFIEFNMYFRDYYYGTDFAEIKVSTDGGSSWDSLQTWYNTHNGFELIDVSTYCGNSDVKIAFRYYSNGWNYYFEVDDVTIYKSIPNKANHSLNLQVNWENLEYNLPEEYLCIKTGDLSSEILYIDIWNTSTSLWDNQVIQLTENAWNNISISNWSTSSTFTIRYRADDETEDAVQNTWEIDVALLHLWELSGTIFYEGHIKSDIIQKPSAAEWSSFFVEVNNPGNGVFKVLDSSNTVLISDLNDGSSISSVSEDEIYLYGDFSGSARLDSWKVTVEDSDWTEYQTDTTSDEWSWSFNFPNPATNLTRFFYFYSMGQKSGWPSESAPTSPDYDTYCLYED